MIIYQNYAMIQNDTVMSINVVEDYTEANRLAQALYGEVGLAVDVTQYHVKEGDKYRNGLFYSVAEDGTETIIDPIPTVDQEVSMLRAENDQITESVVDIDYKLCQMELGL